MRVTETLRYVSNKNSATCRSEHVRGYLGLVKQTVKTRTKKRWYLRRVPSTDHSG